MPAIFSSCIRVRERAYPWNASLHRTSSLLFKHCPRPLAPIGDTKLLCFRLVHLLVHIDGEQEKIAEAVLAPETVALKVHVDLGRVR